MLLIRKLGLMHWLDQLYFHMNRLRYRRRNRRFIAQHPDITLPPEYMLYEAYRMDYEAYYQDGMETARWIKEQAAPFLPSASLHILEWGCGPARIIRHLPSVFPGAIITGTDYNRQTIDWCRASINGVQFTVNGLLPPLPFGPASFDMVYALSVFTHLSGEAHPQWLHELHRILRPGGLLLFTTQGEAFLDKLSAKEKERFNKGKLVERGKVMEGHRAYSAFQPGSYMRSAFSNNWKVLRFIPGRQMEWGIEQDTWLVQKTVV